MLAWLRKVSWKYLILFKNEWFFSICLLHGFVICTLQKSFVFSWYTNTTQLTQPCKYKVIWRCNFAITVLYLIYLLSYFQAWVVEMILTLLRSINLLKLSQRQTEQELQGTIHILRISTCMAQNLIWLPSFLQNKRILFSTLHSDKNCHAWNF